MRKHSLLVLAPFAVLGPGRLNLLRPRNALTSRYRSAASSEKKSLPSIPPRSPKSTVCPRGERVKLDTDGDGKIDTICFIDTDPKHEPQFRRILVNGRFERRSLDCHIPEPLWSQLDVTREIEVRERLKEFYDLVRRLAKVSCNCRVNSVYSEGRVRLLLALILPLSLAGFVAAESRVIAVSVDNVVHPITVEILKHAIDVAKRQRADFLLIRLNTPGGMLEATRQAIEKIIASPIPVVTFVTPTGGRASSAGFFLLESGDIAAMADGTNAGAASAVLLGGEQMDPVMRKKVDSDAAALLRGLVSKHGRNADLAEKAVFEAKSFSDREALENKLIDLVAHDEQDLLRQLDSRAIVRFDGRRETLRLSRAQIIDYSPTIREKILSSISDPNIAFILLILGALGIYVEYLSPGLIFPGVAGGILLLLGLSALSMLPINWTGAALLLLSSAFFVLEAKFASHGILGIGGIVAMILGALLLINGPPEMRIRVSTAFAVSLPFGAVTLFLVSLVVRARAQKVVTGMTAMRNMVGVALTALSPAGQVLIRGEYWNAVSATPVAPGVSVRVIDVEGLTLRVEPNS